MSTMNDTIVAISSPPGRSLRGLVRLSGPDTRAILQSLLSAAPSRPRQLTTCILLLPAENQSNRTLHLPVLALTFTPPASYTSQAMAEIQCPGHPALLQRIVHRVIDLGARMAEPGEFTFRAYLAGKLDLTQAEGVAATIAAQSDAQLQAATQLRQGKLGQWSTQLVDQLAESLAAVEAGIDFTDQEDVRPIDAPDLDVQLQQLIAQLDRTLASSQDWARLDALASVVLVGQPSVGKSTLFNALLGRERSVISPQPGTTRDILAEPLSLQCHGQNVQVMLTDIAGLDSPVTAMDHLVQQAARDAIAQAQVLVAVGDDMSPPPDLPNVRQPVVRVRAKADLPPRRPVDEAELPIVAPTRQGLDELRHAIASQLQDVPVSATGELMALQPRHQQAMRHAKDELNAARDLLTFQRQPRGVDQPELVASSLRSALDALAALGGQMTPDDVIGRVFAKFCVGK